ncbi:MAG: hypothetical protein B7Z08_11645 [Sphingomonadales bacterium 32-68-7]|nr:MAG: hypothetical protein B7Z08_11645 [Sphingomonadales bacterium 32-68-7]
MSERIGQPLLAQPDPSPVQVHNPGGASPFLLLGDHAGNAIPAALGALGLGPADLGRHIAWDLGIAALGPMLADRLDAPFISQAYSRLVIDCNRDPDGPEAIVEVSDGTPVPGNRGLSEALRRQRIAAIHRPYHDAVAQALRERHAAGVQIHLVSLHSFTPTMDGFDRPWEIGVLHGDGHTRLAHALLQVLRARRVPAVGDNEPYAFPPTCATG